MKPAGILRSRLLVAAASAVVTAVTVGAVAYAAIPDAAGVIHGCRSANRGSLRVIDHPAERCGNGEVALNWSQSGPQGPAGPQGPQGPAGSGGAARIICGGCGFRTNEFEGADWSGAYVADSSFTGIWSGANFRGADLHGSQISPFQQNSEVYVADFSGVDFRDADLRQVAFYATDLRGADFRGADLGYVQFNGGPANTQLQGADFSGLDFERVTFQDVDLTGVDLSSVTLGPNTRFVRTVCPDGTYSPNNPGADWMNGGSCTGHLTP